MAAKAIVLVLLAVSGFSDALKCYECTGQGFICAGGNQREVECPAQANGCTVSKTTGTVSMMIKSCVIKDASFDCLQEKLGQTGDCVKGTVEEMEQYVAECGAGSITSDGQLNISSIIVKVSVNGVEVPKGSGIKVKQTDMLQMCICSTDLCNTDDFGDGEDESTSTQPSNPSTDGNTAPSNPTDGSTAPSNPTDGNTDATSPGDGNTAPSTTPEDSGASVVGAGAVTVSGMILLMVNRLFH